jgi:hypothetical protein
MSSQRSPRAEFRFAHASDSGALQRFSARLSNTVFAPWPLARVPLPGADSLDDSFPVRRRRLIAECEGEIRAIQNFYEHELYIEGQPHQFIWPTAPLAEGVIDPKYTSLGVALLRHSLALQPLHMAFGALAADKVLARVFKVLRWDSARISMWAYPIHVARICGSVPRLRSTWPRAFAMSLARCSGAAGVASTLLRARRSFLRWPDLQVQEVEAFGEWADLTWSAALNEYRALTRRDTMTLNRLYRRGDKRITRLRVQKSGRDIGWIIVAVRDFHNDPTFGSIRLALLVDGLAGAAHSIQVMRVALEFAATSGADLCLGYWSHQAWKAAAKRLGFFEMPSSATLYVSPAARSLMLTEERPLEVVHLTRGDCDGPESFLEPEVRKQQN